MHHWVDKVSQSLVSLTILRKEGNVEADLVCKGSGSFKGIEFFCYALVLF